MASKFCTYCNSNTNQKLVFETSKWHTQEVAFKNEKDDLSESAWTIKNVKEEVFQCLGCERIHIYYTEEVPNKDPNYEPLTYQTPKKIERAQPSWIKDINLDYFEVLGEMYSNYNHSNFISFAILCRTLIDTILTDTLGDIGGFEKKMNQYKSDGHITNSQYDILNFLVNAGNASAHRAFKPSKEISESLLDIVEHTLKESVLNKKSKKYTDDIPARKAK